ncbi:MAG TPA: Ku protein [Candidatus Saccharimonadales bacterium]
MRPIWNGSISFGLVNIPVRLYSGAEMRKGLDLDMLHKEDHSPIRFARVCRKDGKEVPWDDIIKGYEYQHGDYVELSQKDLAKASAEKTQTIDIQQFVEEGEIDIRYFEKPYYLEPIKGGEKAYALLHAALEESEKLALVQYVMHERQHLGVIKPVGKALVLDQMRFPTDLREATDLKFPNMKVEHKELEVALKLVRQETKRFIPEDFHDTFTEELEDIIEAKIKGKKLPKHGEKRKDTSSKDLMSALKASLKQ